MIIGLGNRRFQKEEAVLTQRRGDFFIIYGIFEVSVFVNGVNWVKLPPGPKRSVPPGTSLPLAGLSAGRVRPSAYFLY